MAKINGFPGVGVHKNHGWHSITLHDLSTYEKLLNKVTKGKGAMEGWASEVKST
jgi:hypothetical protein